MCVGGVGDVANSQENDQHNAPVVAKTYYNELLCLKTLTIC